MRAELVQKFYDRWPNWFRGLHESPMCSCLAFGFECGDGWFNLLWNLCEDIEKMNLQKDFKVCQIKEKFGQIRCYISSGNDEIFDRIEQAEQESYKICEACGSTEDVTSEGSWITTLCKECRNG